MGHITTGRSLLVLLDAGIVDNAAPIEAEGEVVGVAVGILIAAQVARHVFKLLLDGLHVGRHLHGKQGEKGQSLLCPFVSCIIRHLFVCS